MASINEKKVMNLKESKDGYKKEFEREGINDESILKYQK